MDVLFQIIVFFFQVQRFIVNFLRIFVLIMPKVFLKCNAICETEFLTIVNERIEFEAYC